MKISEEKQLIKLAQKGDEKAFGELISCNEEYIKKWILHFAKGNETVAEEVYQQALIKCWKNLKNFKGNSRFATWVNVIARNKYYDEYRRIQRSPLVVVDENVLNVATNELPSDRIEKKDESAKNILLVKAVLNKLSPCHREILLLYESEGLNYREISKVLHISEGTVMSRLFYARKNAQRVALRYKRLLTL